MTLRLALPLAFALAAGSLAASATLAQDAPPYGYPQQVYDTDGQSVDSVAVFFEPLSRYGRWLDTRFGRAWSPNVGRDWRPYTIGHWEEGPYGQTWRSDEPFGWAVYHFGRWGFDPAIGWVWTPDTVWGPAWVAWRDGDDVAGWAPLPPRVSLSFDFGTAYGDGFNAWGYDQWYQPGWVYVPRGYLYGRSLRGAILPYGRNRDYWSGTRGVTRYDRVDGRVFNRSFDHGGRDDGRRDDGRRDDGRRGDGRRGDGRHDDPRPDDARRGDVQRGYGQRGEFQRGDVQGGDFRGGDGRVLTTPGGDPRGYAPRRGYGRPADVPPAAYRDPRGGGPRPVGDTMQHFGGGNRAAPLPMGAMPQAVRPAQIQAPRPAPQQPAPRPAPRNESHNPNERPR